MEPLECESAPSWDASIVDSSFAYNAAMLAPCYILVGSKNYVKFLLRMGKEEHEEVKK